MAEAIKTTELFSELESLNDERTEAQTGHNKLDINSMLDKIKWSQSLRQSIIAQRKVNL